MIILYIVEVIDEFLMNLTLIELKLNLTWKLIDVCFEVKIGFFLLLVLMVASINYMYVRI